MAMGGTVDSAGRPFDLAERVRLHDMWLEHEENGTPLRLHHCSLPGSDLSGRVLHHTDFDCSDLTSATFKGSDCDSASFARANLANADLRGAYLYEACFVEACLRGADLSGSDLSGVDFEGADLSGANLTDVIKADADFIDAKMDGVIGLPLAVPGLARKVLSQITKHPETHDQHDFESPCGTKRCAAGWACHLAGPDYEVVERRFGTWNAAMLALGVPLSDRVPFGASDDPIPWLEELARKEAGA